MRARIYAMESAIRLTTRLHDRVQGAVASRFRESDRHIDIRVRNREEDRNTVTDIENLIVAERDGIPVTLSAVADIGPARGPAEIHRILTELTAMLGESSDELEFLLDGLARLDALHARAAFADRQDAQDVEFTEDGSVRLKGARHLLVEGCVPIDLVLPPGTRALVLSGANAGGKTVGLKTLGTTTYLAACGYHVPVGPHSRTVFPRRYFCMIGDEQSLEHNLSSFSSHVTAATAILGAIGPGDLVLLTIHAERDRVLAWIAHLAGSGWQPGHALPPEPGPGS